MKKVFLTTSIIILFVIPVFSHDFSSYCDDVVQIGSLYSVVYASDDTLSLSGDKFRIMMNSYPATRAQYAAFEEKRGISGLAFMASGISALVGVFYGLNAANGGAMDVGYLTANIVSFGLFTTAGIWNYIDSNDNLYAAVHEYNRMKCGEPHENHHHFDRVDSMLMSMGTVFRF